MKLLLLSRYDRLGASSRLRMLQYVPFLRQQGMEVTVRPLLSNSYLEALYRTGRRPPKLLIAAYTRRILTLLALREHDLLWIEKELLPWFPAWFERLLMGRRARYVVDYDDATFHHYDLHPNPAARSLYRGKIDALMRHATLVVAGNAYLADRAGHAGSAQVTLLPTVVDLSRYPAIPAARTEESPFTIGWMGSPSTLRYLDAIRPALAEVCRLPGVRIVIVGAGPADWPDLKATFHPWSELTEIDELRSFDIGIMPLDNTPWERGKCGYKLIQYMACGLPVVASPVGVNAQIVKNGVTGILADTTEKWVDALNRLRQNPGLRQAMGRQGRRDVEERYCLERTGPLLMQWLEQIQGGRQPTPTGPDGNP
ncbi:MAG: glycosyltransferase family 4 protein [bacterium]